MQHHKSNSLIPVITHIMYQYQENFTMFAKSEKPFHVEVGLADGLFWIPVYFVPGSAELAEPSAEHAQGKLYNQLLKYRVPGDDSADLARLERLHTLPVIIKITFSDGIERIMGAPDNPALYASDFASSAKSTGANAAFRCQASHRLRILDTEDPPGSGGPAIIDPTPEL